MAKTRKLPVRLAFREEGRMWNAYLALRNTMDGALLVGSIAMGPAIRNPAVKAAFIALMKQVLTEAVEELTGSSPNAFFEEPAPDNERGGSA